MDDAEYFRAPDRAAAKALHRKSYALFDTAARHGCEALAPGLVDVGDPFGAVNKLVGLLSGPSYEEIVFSCIPTAHIPPPEEVAASSSGLLVELSEVVRDTLADASDQALEEAAPLWVMIEEFTYRTDHADEMLNTARELAALARRARDAGQMLYASISLGR